MLRRTDHDPLRSWFQMVAAHLHSPERGEDVRVYNVFLHPSDQARSKPHCRVRILSPNRRIE